MKFLLYTKTFITVLIFGLSPLVSFASELRLDINRVDVRAGEEFSVKVVLFADEPVNAVEGRIVFSKDLLIVKDIHDGNSSVNFWIERPQEIQGAGEILFSGITPGGLSGTNNLLFSIMFEATKTGTAVISISDAKALLNDGEGTETPLAIHNVTIEIKTGNGIIQKEKMKDKVPPESFVPMVARDPLMFDGKWFVAFATSDKDSGVLRYEIKEYRFKPLAYFLPWRITHSPHVLSDQALKSHIIIRAVDGAGNIQMATISPANAPLWYELIFYWLILISVTFGVLYGVLKIWKRNF